MATRGKPELGEVVVAASGDELSKAMGSIWPRAHKGAKGKGFGSNAGEIIKGMSRDSIREV